MQSKTKYFLFLTLTFVVIYAIALIIQRKKPDNKIHSYYQMQMHSFDKTSNKVATELLKDQKSHSGILEFTNGTPISTKMGTAYLCADHYADIEKVDLYMPDMGHGSQPPTMSHASDIPENLQKKGNGLEDFGCLDIQNMQLFMPGLWQVRAFYKDGTVGTIDVTLKE